MRKQMRILAAALALAFAPIAGAQTTTTPPQNHGQAHVASRIAGNFTTLAGGPENSLALVNSLRTGTAVNLVTVVPPPAGSPPGTAPTSVTTTFTPPTRPMGWGNVRHSLALAQDQLARAGIANPTAEHLRTALMGGDLVRTNTNGTTTTTSVRGVLTMRAEGMGWGNIAKAGGTKLGPVTSKVDMSASTAKASRGIATAATGSAAGSTVGNGPAKGVTTAAGAGTTHGSRGLVTAGGGSANVASASHGKPPHAGGGAGVVTGGGNSASGVTSANAGGNGRGNGGGNGHGKGKAG